MEDLPLVQNPYFSATNTSLNFSFLSPPLYLPSRPFNWYTVPLLPTNPSLSSTDPSRMRGLFGGSHFNLQPNIKGKEREREKEKEQTKLRERHRRAITSRMLAGLRQYGNFPLLARVDMNDVLAALAREAGCTVEADGTTYQQSLPPAQMKEGGIVAWKVWDQFSVFPIIEPQTGVLLKEASRGSELSRKRLQSVLGYV